MSVCPLVNPFFNINFGTPSKQYPIIVLLMVSKIKNKNKTFTYRKQNEIK
jgi:hypothetical protein